MLNFPTSPIFPENWPFSLELLPPPAYLVGGAVRDALLGRVREYLDLDFVMAAGAVETARKIAHHYKAGFVLLDEKRQIARVVFKAATADFAQQEGNNLEMDLKRRDFTINAIAYNPHTDQIIDFLAGEQDLRAGLLRMVAPSNLQDDPLRLLRAYRQAAQLGFSIETTTRAAIRQFAPLLAEIAAERVRTELSYMLAIPQGTHHLQAASEDGLLQTWFPSASSNKISLISAIDGAASLLQQNYPPLKAQLQRNLRHTIKTSLLALAKLATLVDSNCETAQKQLLNLKYSRAEIQAVLAMLTNISYLLQKPEKLSLREKFFLFRNVGEMFPPLAVMAVAMGVSPEKIYPFLNRFFNPSDPLAHPQPPVTGKDIMAGLNKPPGPEIGWLLTEICIARAEGKISTPEEALELASNLTFSPE